MLLEGEPITVLSHVGYNKKSRCGYCSNPSGSYTFGLWAHSLTVEHYQKMIDRGWRRSGKYLYKPDLRASCCPQYTIRLDPTKFKPNKDQRRALNKFNRFILGDETYDAALKHLTRKEAEVKSKTAKEQPSQPNPSPKSKPGKDTFSLPLHTSLSTNPLPSPLPQPAHTFTCTLSPPTSTPEKFSLYKAYQIRVHNDPASKITEDGFNRFLCDNPFEVQKEGGRRWGTWHQEYRVDGRLVALAVLDLLPRGVSSVYLIYDNDIGERFALGRVSALREIALCEQLVKEGGEGGEVRYYMGFWIWGCEKMRYKGEYAPSEVLDPEGMGWVELKALENALEQSGGKYVSLSGEETYSTPSEPPTTQEDEEGEEEGTDSPPGTLFATNMPGITSLPSLRASHDIDEQLILVNGMVADFGWLRAKARRLGKSGVEGMRMVLEEVLAGVGVEVGKEVVVAL
ncbi:hypothetical protein G7K_2144-t1 [Saitoella complicata NRRL Y-17804]|uniref:arginyltransferase n=1 Tax=Saitoella complicata (strain BCRC 22490 / CBS 7301 / JCM 7358 / NBRC 10748 / NRRL Y-17804) TaxID=698492 RepID=A0A0E9NDN7_SAICN|nr:hypothetical protein G7K_2144-t1 [Saitoella complicata NRRL Y-17804]